MSVHTDIQTLYLTVYNRPADWEGLVYWTGQIEAEGLGAVNQAFTQAPEFDALYAGQSTEQQVNTLYQHLLGRDAEPGGRAYWAEKLDEGTSIAEVARFITDAAEGEDAAAFEARLDNAEDQTYGEIIDTLYAGYYGRAADEEGKAFWLDAMKSADGDLEPIIEAFGNSDEYVEQYGSMNTELQLDALYNKLFSRDPDPEGAAYWADQLDSGALTLSSLAFTLAQAAAADDKEALEKNIQVAPESAPEPEFEAVAFPTSTGYVDRENGWYVYASVSDVDQTTSIYLRKKVGEVDGLTAILEMEAVTLSSPLLPVFDFRYVGISNEYPVNENISAVRVDGYQSRNIDDINESTRKNHFDNYESPDYDKELSVFNSPDGYDGFLEEMLSSEEVHVKIVPENRYFPIIEDSVSLDGFEEMLDIFDDLSVRREDHIYGSSEQAVSDTLITGDSGSVQVIEIA